MYNAYETEHCTLYWWTVNKQERIFSTFTLTRIVNRMYYLVEEEMNPFSLYVALAGITFGHFKIQVISVNMIFQFKHQNLS
jgi:hypothetical protein